MKHLERFARGFAGLSLVAAAIVFGVVGTLMLFFPLLWAIAHGWQWLGLYIPMVIVAAYFIGADR